MGSKTYFVSLFNPPPPTLRSVHVIESVITSMIKGVAVLIYIMTFHIEEEMIINLILIFWGLLSLFFKIGPGYIELRILLL